MLRIITHLLECDAAEALHRLTASRLLKLVDQRRLCRFLDSDKWMRVIVDRSVVLEACR